MAKKKREPVLARATTKRDERTSSSSSSRRSHKKEGNEEGGHEEEETPYDRKEGSRLYSTFWQTTITGSCLHLLKHVSRSSSSSEYDRAVCYGRPLFALMAKKGILENNIPHILHRMIRVVNWENNRNAWINSLWTRLPMGTTTAEVVVSDLVAHSFANACGYDDDDESEGTRQLVYCTDPVCARLAMCMMDEDYHQWIPKIATIKGMAKKWWATKLKEIYSSGIVNPDEEGDIVKVVVALYMLFCGDVLQLKHGARERNEWGSSETCHVLRHRLMPMLRRSSVLYSLVFT
jgi:hypothetical protein